MATNGELRIALDAASRVVGSGRLLVIGSQSILGKFAHHALPPEASASMEFDVAFIDDVDSNQADRIDAALGEWSPFHDEHGFYVQGVDVDTAALSDGWQERAVRVPLVGHPDVEAMCLEPHDTCAAKLARNDDRDRAFVASLVAAELIDPRIVEQRIQAISPHRLAPARKRVAVSFLRYLQQRREVER